MQVGVGGDFKICIGGGSSTSIYQMIPLIIWINLKTMYNDPNTIAV